MQIDKNVRAVERIFSQIDKASNNFINQTGIKCQAGCTICCHGKSVTAAPLEFLPYAYHLYKTGELENRYWALKDAKSEGCFLVEGDSLGFNGRCGIYEHRGIICRLFGNSAMMNKNGEKLFSACSILKAKISDQDKFKSALNSAAPVYSNYYMQLRNIDSTNGGMQFPINIAILKSMELVYNNTRRKRKRAV